jgi:hypothetical protein
MRDKMSFSVKALRANKFFGSENRRDSHLAKRLVSRVSLGGEQSDKVREASSAARSTKGSDVWEENFSESGMDDCVEGLEVEAPMVR